jgi:hypothetical protein
MSNNEIIRRAVLSLIREFLKTPSEYEPEIEKVLRKGYEFKGLWRKRLVEQSKIVLNARANILFSQTCLRKGQMI